MSVSFLSIGVSVVAALVSVAATVRSRRAAGGETDPGVLGVGGLLALVLVSVDHGAVLSWRFGVGTGEARVLLPGVGLALGLALLASTGGSLLLGVRLALPTAHGAVRLARAALWLAAAAVGLGAILAGLGLADVADPPRGAGLFSLTLIAAATTALVLALLATTGPPPPDVPLEAARARRAARVALALVLLAAIVCGVEGWWRGGTYATDRTAGAAAAALVGLAALTPPGAFVLALRGLLVLALVGALAG